MFVFPDLTKSGDFFFFISPIKNKRGGLLKSLEKSLHLVHSNSWKCVKLQAMLKFKKRLNLNLSQNVQVTTNPLLDR